MVPAIAAAIKEAFPETELVRGKTDLLREIAISIETRVAESHVVVEDKQELVLAVYQAVYPDIDEKDISYLRTIVQLLYESDTIYVRTRCRRLFEFVWSIFR